MTDMTHVRTQGRESQADRSDCAEEMHFNRSHFPLNTSVATVKNSLSKVSSVSVENVTNPVNHKRKKKKDPMAPRRPLSA
jgi:hypothetical protein